MENRFGLILKTSGEMAWENSEETVIKNTNTTKLFFIFCY
jgi:hypothetical protein